MSRAGGSAGGHHGRATAHSYHTCTATARRILAVASVAHENAGSERRLGADDGSDKPKALRRKTGEARARSRRRGAKLVCLQELFASQYFCQREDAALFDLAEPIPGPTTQAMADGRQGRRASRSSCRSSSGARPASITTVSDRGRTERRRRSGSTARCTFRTTRCFTRSSISRPVISVSWPCETPEAKVGPLICWDQWYPEAARLTALRGAEILVYPTAIGWHPSEKAEYGAAQLSAWQTIQRSHAIANGVFVVAVNRVGHEGAEGRRARILGTLVRRRSVRRRAGRSGRGRRGAGGRVRPRPRRKRCGATGRSSATGASTPTAASARVLLDG